MIVVDNASTDGSASAARAGGADVVRENDRNRGFARAVNRGLDESSADLVLLLNPDAVITDEALARLAECLAADSVAVMAGPMLLSPSGRTIAGARRFSTPVNRLLWHLPLPWRPPGPHPSTSPRGTPWGATDRSRSTTCGAPRCCAVAASSTRSAASTSGSSSTARTRTSDGRQVPASCAASSICDAVVQHIGGASTADAAIAQARVERSTALLIEKWRGPTAAALFRTGIGPVLLLRAAVLRLAGRRDDARLALRTARLLATAR